MNDYAVDSCDSQLALYAQNNIGKHCAFECVEGAWKVARGCEGVRGGCVEGGKRVPPLGGKPLGRRVLFEALFGVSEDIQKKVCKLYEGC